MKLTAIDIEKKLKVGTRIHWYQPKETHQCKPFDLTIEVTNLTGGRIEFMTVGERVKHEIEKYGLLRYFEFSVHHVIGWMREYYDGDDDREVIWKFASPVNKIQDPTFGLL